jgi:hypothetical protein
LNFSFDEIKKNKNYTFKKLLKEKTRSGAYEYLEAQKNRQDKIKDIVYSKLEIQEYLADGERNIEISKTMFKARGKTLDVKLQQRLRYSDTLCSGCKRNEETGEEMLICDSFGENPEKLQYRWFYSSVMSDQVSVGKVMWKKMKAKDKINEGIT